MNKEDKFKVGDHIKWYVDARSWDIGVVTELTGDQIYYKITDSCDDWKDGIGNEDTVMKDSAFLTKVSYMNSPLWKILND